MDPRSPLWNVTASDPALKAIPDFGKTLGYETLRDLHLSDSGSIVVRSFEHRDTWVVECRTKTDEEPSHSDWIQAERSAQQKASNWAKRHRFNDMIVDLSSIKHSGYNLTFSLELQIKY